MAAAIILVRLFVIQVIEHGAWVERAENEHIVQNTIPATRGEIYMMDGSMPVQVVMNETVWTVIVDPMLADPEETEKVVSEAASDKVFVDWKDVFKNRNLRYYAVARNVKREEVKKMQEAELVGVYFRKGSSRVYPEGQMAAGLLGFVNDEGEGQYGAEQGLNEDLKGKAGVLKTVTDANNVSLSIGDDNVRVPAENGKNIVLSVDRNVQRKTEQILQEQLDHTGATHAAGLVMNPQTGEILAVANLPSYDPKNYGKVENGEVFINNAMEAPYEPASMCKTFAFAAAIDQGKMTPDTTYENNGFLVVDGWEIENAYKGQLGTVTMQTALNFSLNTGSMTALKLLGGNPDEINQKGREKLYEYYHDRFGLGEYTGIELYEAKGLIADPNTGFYGNGYGLNSIYANMTFGQNINLTMIQMAAAFSSVINGGEFYTPTIVAGEMKNGIFVERDIEEPVRQTVSEQTSETMRQMLYGARSSKRLYGIDRPGYYVGGKTGTAQGIKDGEYTFDETTGSYIGFGGATGELPEYVIMVKIWGENMKMEGEAHAMPMFDKISNYMIDYLKIKPGEEINDAN